MKLHTTDSCVFSTNQEHMTMAENIPVTGLFSDGIWDFRISVPRIRFVRLKRGIDFGLNRGYSGSKVMWKLWLNDLDLKKFWLNSLIPEKLKNFN